MKEKKPEFRVVFPDGMEVDILWGFVNGVVDADKSIHYAYCPDEIMVDGIEHLLKDINQRNSRFRYSLQKEIIAKDEDD